VKAALGRRGAADRVDELLDLDARRRALLTEVEERRGAKKKVSERIAQAKRAGEEAADAIAESNAIGRELGSLEQDLADVERRIDALLITVPNLPDPSAPDGFTEEDAEVVRVVGDPPAFGFEPRDHLDIGTSLGLIDMEAAARASGSRFAYLKGELAFLELALVQYALRKLAGKGFEPVIPPVLVR
jgi:seryl-tRNA synthetase